MKMRSLLMGLVIAAAAQSGVTAARAETVILVDIKLPIKKAGTTSDVPANTIAEIKVDGSLQKGPYDSVQTKTLDYIIAARGEKHKKLIGPLFSLTMDGDGDGGGDLSEGWKYFALTRDYIDPRVTGVEGRRVSPIDLCNAKLNAAKGADRTAFLKKGAAFIHKDAYEVTGEVSVDTFSGPTPMIDESETIQVPVRITCMALDRPRPRENSGTKGPPPREGKKMKPTISDVSLRIEPMQITQMGKFLCPAQLRLYGKLETIREFTGKSVFVGPHYISKIHDITLKRGPVNTVTATYPMTWQKMGDKAVAPNAGPAKQKMTFRYNVSNKDGKVLESAERTIEVSCRPIKVDVPTAGDGMTVNPAN
jgi:hypothetical protein